MEENNVQIVGNHIPSSTVNPLGGNDQFIPGYQHPYPNICPGCGRCRDCGQPAMIPAPIPYNPPHYPYQDPYMPITCGVGGTQPSGGPEVIAVNSTISK